MSLLDIVVLLYHVHLGAQTQDVGFEDAQHTLESLTKNLMKHTALIPPEDLESCLWSCNLLNEKGTWWHPRGVSFDEFVNRMLGTHEKFNRIYNLIESSKE